MWITHSYAYCCWAMRSRWYKPTIISTTMWEEQKDEVHWYLIKTGFQAPKFQLVFFVIYLFFACSQCLLLETIFVVSLSCFISIPENRQFFSTSFEIFFVCLFNAESERWFQMYAHFCAIWKKNMCFTTVKQTKLEAGLKHTIWRAFEFAW